MITNQRKQNLNVGLSKFSESQLPSKESMQKQQVVSIPTAKKGLSQIPKQINQINSAKEQQRKEEFTEFQEEEKQQKKPLQQLEDQFHIPIGKHHIFNERKRAFSSPQPFYHFMRDSHHIKEQLIATPTFGDDDWKSRQLQNTKDKKDGISACQSSPSNHSKFQGYDIFPGNIIQNNSSIINMAKESNLQAQIMNNDSIGLQLKLGNNQLGNHNEYEMNKKGSSGEIESPQRFVEASQSMFYQTPHLFPQQTNPNDQSCQSVSALESFEGGVNSSTALKHPKISKKSPLFEKFGQQANRQRSPDLHYNLNNPNLSAYNYPSISKQSSKYSNMVLGNNNSSSSLQNSQCTHSLQQIGISTEGDQSTDQTPIKKNGLNNLYNHSINTGRSASDKKQISYRQINTGSVISAFNLRNNSEASIVGNQQNSQHQQPEKNLKINLNTSSFLPQIDQPSSNIQMSQQIQSAKHQNEVRMHDRGFSEEGSSSILNNIQRSNNFTFLAKQNFKRVNSIDDQTLSTCFTSIKASSPIKKNRNDIFNEFPSNVNSKVPEGESQMQTSSQNKATNNQVPEENSSHQLNLLQGDKLNFSNVQQLSKRGGIPPNSNQDRYEENSALKYKEAIRKKSREQSLRQISPQNTLELLKKKNTIPVPQTVSNTIGSLIQYTTRDETIDDLLNLQLEKIDLKKQNSQKRSSPSLEYKRNHNSNPLSSEIPEGDYSKQFANPPPQINSYRHRKPTSIHIIPQDTHKRAESAKNKTKLNFFQNSLLKKDIYGKKIEPESAKFSHPGRKLSIKQNDQSLIHEVQSKDQKGKLIIPLPSFHEVNSSVQHENDIENLYNPQQDTMQRQTEKICTRIQGIFYKQKEMFESKYKRKLTANKEETDLLKQLNTALDELKNVHTYSSQTSSTRNHISQPAKQFE